MIIAGVLLLILAAYLPPVLPLPDPIYPLAHLFGVILLVVGFILLVLNLFGIGTGRGLVTVRGRRTWL